MSKKKERGDFQTPDLLAIKVLSKLRDIGYSPDLIIEPTCGLGSFLFASAETYPDAEILGFEINETYVNKTQDRSLPKKITVETVDFFSKDWQGLFIDRSFEELLIVGNPPWVTSSGMSKLSADNLPNKNNLKGLKGIEAITGGSNFDISEWIVLELIKCVPANKRVCFAFILKTSVIRNIIESAQSLTKRRIEPKGIWFVDAKKSFNASVDAGLFVFDIIPGEVNEKTNQNDCRVYNDLTTNKSFLIGLREGCLIADIEKWESTCHLSALKKSKYIWRSGVKHDCSKVMELTEKNGVLVNKLGETVDIEEDLLFPLYKSSDLSKGKWKGRYVIVTQESIGQCTDYIENKYPKLWSYLEQNEEYFEKRKSSIYRDKPRFSIFGVGDYSFEKWKVAISGMYKHLRFRLIAPMNDKPVMLDDTCYFIGFQSEEEAVHVYEYMTSAEVSKFLESRIFWDSQRPITKKLLSMLKIDDYEEEPIPYQTQLFG